MLDLKLNKSFFKV